MFKVKNKDTQNDSVQNDQIQYQSVFYCKNCIYWKALK